MIHQRLQSTWLPLPARPMIPEARVFPEWEAPALTVAFGRLVRDLKFPDLRFHDLRHDTASTLTQGAELYLLVAGEGRRRGCEFKRTDASGVTKCMHVAIQDLGLESLDVVHAGRDTYPLARKIRALAISRLTTELGRAPPSRATIAHHLAHAAPRAAPPRDAHAEATRSPRSLRCRHPMDIVPT